MSKVRLEGYLVVPPERVFQVATALPNHIALTLAEPGCVSFQVSQSPTTPEHFLVSEVFLDQAAFDKHQARAEASAWGEVTAGLDRHYTITLDDDHARQPAAASSPHDHDNIQRQSFPVPDAVREQAMSQGEPGQIWLASLDDVLASLEQDWALAIGPAIDGARAAFVAPATTASGDAVILKVTIPGPDVGRHEALVLGQGSGKGYAELLRHDPSRNAMLLEVLGERLDTLALPLERQIDVMCATLLEAWMPVPADFAGSTGADKANDLAQLILTLWSGAGQPCAQSVIDTALLYCRDRAAVYRAESAVLAHGNPSPANTLMAPETNPPRFKFISPNGLAVEPAYDLGVILSTWNDGIGGRHAHDIARSHARHLTARTQVPAEAIWQWGYIERVATGLRLLQSGDPDLGQTLLDIAESLTSTAS